MKKDIFIDNNVACRFSNPMDPEMIKLVAWLMDNTADIVNRAILVVSKKLLEEYSSSCRGAASNTAIPSIVDNLQRNDRLSFISNKRIKNFQKKYFTKKVEKHLRSNAEDREHIPVVLLSDRKYALTNDSNLAEDLRSFPGFSPVVSSRPEDIPYK